MPSNPPFTEETTMFTSHVGNLPSWFKYDKAPVQTLCFSCLDTAKLWINRRRRMEYSPVRVIVRDANGSLYWLMECAHPVPMYAIDCPDFSNYE